MSSEIRPSRFHLFEFEDLAWFPDWIRQMMTMYIRAFHRVLGTEKVIAPLLARAVAAASQREIVDLCSGGGGPMPDVMRRLQADHGIAVKTTLTDLYPNQTAIAAVKAEDNPLLSYHPQSVDAGNVPSTLAGARTMICSFHHMPAPVAQRILNDAFAQRRPFLLFEVSDNEAPQLLWWLAIPFNIFTVLLFTPFIRPLTWQQIVFTYVIPILPVLIAWDGSVSNVRTYRVKDLEKMTAALQAPDYKWEIARIKKKGYPSTMPYVLGLPA